MMIQLAVFRSPNKVNGSNLSRWFVTDLEIFEKGRPLDRHFWTSIGPLITMGTIHPLWRVENGNGVKFSAIDSLWISRYLWKNRQMLDILRVNRPHFHELHSQTGFLLFSFFFKLCPLNHDPNHGWSSKASQIWAVDSKRPQNICEKANP